MAKKYVNLPLSELKLILKKMSPETKKKYTRKSILAERFQNRLLGTGKNGPIKKRRPPHKVDFYSP